MLKIRSIIEDLSVQLTQGLFNYIPVMMALGIGIFFGLSFDPNILHIAALTLISFSISILLRLQSTRIIAIALLSILVGIIASYIRIELCDHTILEHELDKVEVNGIIHEISYQDSKSKLFLSDIEIEGEDAAPTYISVSTRASTNELKLGDRITFKANLMPPPKPTLPGGFNYAFYAYFKKIGALGVTVSGIDIISHEEVSGFWARINIVRSAITKRLESSMSYDTASIASALIVGDAKRIPKDVYDSIRISGIAHVIAISGLHIVTVVGLVFFASRYLFGRVPYFVGRHNIKKWAAIVSIAFSFIYLVIAGMPISAQRAFIMSSLVMCAIILDRDPDALRALTIAAIIILLVFPESLFSASFQMSFAACYGLIGAYRYTALALERFALNKYIKYFVSLTCATVIAGAVTTPFVIYHFNQFSTYSVLTNFIVIPLVDFVIMPSVVLSMLAMPFSLEYLPLKILELGINIMILVSKFVSDLPNSALLLPKVSDTGIVVIALSLFLMLATSLKFRVIFMIPIVLVILLNVATNKLPDIIIDKGGKLFAIRDGDNLRFSSLMPAKFVRKTWQQTFGIEHPLTIKGYDMCSSLGCAVSNAFVAIKEVVEEDCSKYNIIFDLSGSSPCTNIIVPRREQGTHVVTIDGSDIVVTTVYDSILPRKWNSS